MGVRTIPILLLLVSGCQSAVNCPAGYNYQFGDSCYEVSHDKTYWTSAEVSCEVMEGHLVEIDSISESYFVKKIAYQHGARSQGGFWIGLTNKRADYQWRWATSHQVARGRFEDWAPGEPDNSDSLGENCALIEDRNGHSYRWADVNCMRLEAYICEYRQPTPVLIG